MDNRVIEQSVTCPFCGETLSILLDLSAGDQSYIEDCQVCCQPMKVSIELESAFEPAFEDRVAPAVRVERET